MKKAITILAIIAIVAGAVFAGDPVHDGASAIKVTTSVSNVEPFFVLKSGNVTSAAHASNNQQGERTPVATDDATAAALAGNTSVVITTNDLLNANQTVTFNVHQTNATKAIKKYQLSATATDLVLYKYKDSTGAEVLVSTKAHPAADGLKKFTVEANAVSTFANGALTAAQATYAGTGSAKTIEYLGTNVAADTKVASFTCTWQQNADAVVGDYQGTVTLTVATV